MQHGSRSSEVGENNRPGVGGKHKARMISGEKFESGNCFFEIQLTGKIKSGIK